MRVDSAAADILSFVQQIFGTENVTVLDLPDPDAAEISIESGDAVAGEITVSLYDELYLFIAGINLEFGEASSEAIENVKRYLLAAKEGRLRKTRSKILGVPLLDKLEIDS